MTAWKKTQAKVKEIRITLIVSRDSKKAAAWISAFRQKGFYAIHEKTPRHALQAARLLSPSVTIVDLDMPRIERLALCDELRSMTSHALFVVDSNTTQNVTPKFNPAGATKKLANVITPLALANKSMAWMAN